MTARKNRQKKSLKELSEQDKQQLAKKENELINQARVKSTPVSKPEPTKPVEERPIVNKTVYLDEDDTDDLMALARKWKKQNRSNSDAKKIGMSSALRAMMSALLPVLEELDEAPVDEAHLVELIQNKLNT